LTASFAAAAAVIIISSSSILIPFQSVYASLDPFCLPVSSRSKAPIATSSSGDHAYVTWWTNKSGDWEVMFKSSDNGGKTWSNKTNLSNTKGSISNDASIAASQGGNNNSNNNVYVTWWEHNDNSTANDNQVLFRASTDGGKTFGKPIILSEGPLAAAPPSSAK
jgi:hypothetical protein